MSNRMRAKSIYAFLVVLLCVCALGFFLNKVQTYVAVSDQKLDLQQQISQMEERIAQADEEAIANKASYDEVYQAKATTTAYIAQKSETFEPTNAMCADLATRMNVNNVLLLDNQGNVVASAQASPADFTKARFNQLRTVFETNQPSEGFTVDFPDGVTYRYFGARISDTLQAVVEQDPQELEELIQNTSSWESVLNSMSVGLDGFAMAVSTQEYTILYHPDESMVGTDALGVGVDVLSLEHDSYGWMDIDGQRYYCGTALLESDNAYVICAIPEAEIMSTSTMTIGLVLAVFTIVMLLIAAYAVMMMNHEERRGLATDPKRYIKLGGLYYNRKIGQKISVIIAVGLVAILAMTFYMQTLFSISSHSVSNLMYTEEVESIIKENDEYVESLQAQYDRRYLNKCQMASYILSENPQLATKADMTEMAAALGVHYLFVFDAQGHEVVSNAPYVNVTLSQNPEDQTYEFNKLLNGVEYVIQEPQKDETQGQYLQYIGVPLYTEEGNPDGFVQIALVPDKLEEALSAASLGNVLQTVRPGVNGFSFAVSKEDSTFAYYPEQKLIGRSALDYGLTEGEMKDGFSDFISLDGETYYASCLELDSEYVYTVVPKAEMTDSRLPIALVTGLSSLVCFALLFLVVTMNSVRRAKSVTHVEMEDGKPKNIEISMPDGTKKTTQTASSRWSGVSMLWHEKTPEQKMGTILRVMLFVAAAAICAYILLVGKGANPNSVMSYVLSGGWEHKPSIFSLTACLMVVCVTAVLTMAVHSIMRYLSKTLNTRGATICRLLGNAAKYVGTLVAFFVCLSLVGVDTTTLLASAGLLTLIVGLGAQDLTADILAGLFIIFEGEFRVGDIVKIGDFRGTVLEIGIRTTKVEDADGNVKVFSNSSISGVVNMTKNYSFATIEVDIDHTEDIERVEAVLARELPPLKSKLKTIVGGPYYNGVSMISSSAVTLKVTAQCEEKHRVGLTRDLYRAMKIIFDANDVDMKIGGTTNNITVNNNPFVDTNFRSGEEERKEATFADKWASAKYNEEQEVARNDFRTADEGEEE